MKSGECVEQRTFEFEITLDGACRGGELHFGLGLLDELVCDVDLGRLGIDSGVSIASASPPAHLIRSMIAKARCLGVGDVVSRVAESD